LPDQKNPAKKITKSKKTVKQIEKPEKSKYILFTVFQNDSKNNNNKKPEISK